MKKYLIKILTFALVCIPLTFLNSQSADYLFSKNSYEYLKGKVYLKSQGVNYEIAQNRVVVKLKDNLDYRNISFSKYNLPKFIVKKTIINDKYYILTIPKDIDVVNTIIKKYDYPYIYLLGYLK